MAKIICGNYTVDIQFVGYHPTEDANDYDNTIDYRIQFTYGDNVIFNPLITDKNYFLINADAEDDLLTVLKTTLYEDKPEIWEPIETCIFINITPWFLKGFKDTENAEKLSFASKERLQEIDRLRERGGKVLEDVFILEFDILTEGFKILNNKTSSFPEEGLTLGIKLFRYELKQFYSELQEEYKDFCKKFKINHPSTDLEEIIDGDINNKKESPLEKEFDQQMRDIYLKANMRYGMRGDSLIGLIEEHGGRKAAKLILRGRDSASGAMKLRFNHIVDGNGLDLTVEHLVADPKWASLFTKKEIKVAKTRLDQWK